MGRARLGYTKSRLRDWIRTGSMLVHRLRDWIRTSSMLVHRLRDTDKQYVSAQAEGYGQAVC